MKLLLENDDKPKHQLCLKTSMYVIWYKLLSMAATLRRKFLQITTQYNNALFTDDILNRLVLWFTFTY